jgi:methionine sulfoxide reductase heme-binding subunit
VVYGDADYRAKEVLEDQRVHGLRVETKGIASTVPRRAGSVLTRRILKSAIVVAGLLPIAFDISAVLRHRLGPDPYRALMTDSGVWCLWFLAFTLGVTPFRRLTWLAAVATLRRTLGLLAFFYATLHAALYVVFDRYAGLDDDGGLVSTVMALTISTARDIATKPFLAIGVVAFAAMIPLAATSTRPMARHLGGKRWRMLHRLVYGVAIASLLHHWWPLASRFHLADRFALVIVPSLLLRVLWSRRGTIARRASEAGEHGIVQRIG